MVAEIDVIASLFKRLVPSLANFLKRSTRAKEQLEQLPRILDVCHQKRRYEKIQVKQLFIRL